MSSKISRPEWGSWIPLVMTLGVIVTGIAVAFW
jgi:hypothetical protein